MACVRWVKRHIFRESEDFFPYLLPGARGCQRLHPLSSLSETPPVGCVSLARLRFSALSKSHHVVLITWSPSSYTPVRPKWPDAPSSSCLLIKMWKLTKAHGVTRNKPKIHVICYITNCCYYFQVHPDPELKYLLGSHLWVESFCLR